MSELHTSHVSITRLNKTQFSVTADNCRINLGSYFYGPMDPKFAHLKVYWCGAKYYHREHEALSALLDGTEFTANHKYFTSEGVDYYLSACTDRPFLPDEEYARNELTVFRLYIKNPYWYNYPYRVYSTDTGRSWQVQEVDTMQKNNLPDSYSTPVEAAEAAVRYHQRRISMK